MRGRGVLMGAAVASALAVTACGSSGGSGSGASAGIGAGSGGSSGGSASKGAVVLGVLDDTGGPAASIGVLAKQATQLAVDHINATGGAGGHKIKLVFYNTNSDPATTATLATRLITQDHAVAIGCCSTSDTAAAAAAVAARFKVPVLDPAQEESATAKNAKWYGYAFRTAPDNNSLAKFNVQFAIKHGWKRMALDTSSLSYGSEAIPYFKQTIAAEGGKLVAQTTLDATATDASVQAAQIIKAHPQVVLTWDYPQPTAELVKALRAAGSQVPVVSNWSAINTTMNTIAGKLATNVYAHDLADPTNPAMAAYKSEWKAAYHQAAPISEFGIYGYTYVQLFAAALKSASPADAAGITKAMAGLSCVKTVMGNPGACFTYGANNYNGAQAADFPLMKTITNGQWKVVPAK